MIKPCIECKKDFNALSVRNILCESCRKMRSRHSSLKIQRKKRAIGHFYQCRACKLRKPISEYPTISSQKCTDCAGKNLPITTKKSSPEAFIHWYPCPGVVYKGSEPLFERDRKDLKHKWLYDKRLQPRNKIERLI